MLELSKELVKYGGFVLESFLRHEPCATEREEEYLHCTVRWEVFALPLKAEINNYASGRY